MKNYKTFFVNSSLTTASSLHMQLLLNKGRSRYQNPKENEYFLYSLTMNTNDFSKIPLIKEKDLHQDQVDHLRRLQVNRELEKALCDMMSEMFHWPQLHNE